MTITRWSRCLSHMNSPSARSLKLVKKNYVPTEHCCSRLLSMKEIGVIVWQKYAVVIGRKPLAHLLALAFLVHLAPPPKCADQRQSEDVGDVWDGVGICGLPEDLVRVGVGKPESPHVVNDVAAPIFLCNEGLRKSLLDDLQTSVPFSFGLEYRRRKPSFTTVIASCLGSWLALLGEGETERLENAAQEAGGQQQHRFRGD
ncbi:hypothetical protein BDK51DRAFT_30386 [Blyttiomyces helicus]|uniref:Uncharacterized protein n=1 Tax=Blyttiomyces helicus TaxID=388810 RepID=A0A4P9W7U9_9FUNG|nr:hypothetical protein BDK51DRAFT_30386 [Blyttiomyces helicus]|eukprot:RKO86850.1 hypothetical protein BDK51DRAFT_30386 [Blyttiomyces helicus]